MQQLGEINGVCRKMKYLEIAEQRKKGRFDMIRTNRGDASSTTYYGLDSNFKT